MSVSFEGRRLLPRTMHHTHLAHSANHPSSKNNRLRPTSTAPSTTPPSPPQRLPRPPRPAQATSRAAPRQQPPTCAPRRALLPQTSRARPPLLLMMSSLAPRRLAARSGARSSTACTRRRTLQRALHTRECFVWGLLGGGGKGNARALCTLLILLFERWIDLLSSGCQELKGNVHCGAEIESAPV